MTPEAINQAMAELDGLETRLRAWYMPNYTEDLNAVARVVGKLDDESLSGYRMLLRMFADSAIDATAMQRCEAILRAVGKWVEG